MICEDIFTTKQTKTDIRQEAQLNKYEWRTQFIERSIWQKRI